MKNLSSGKPTHRTSNFLEADKTPWLSGWPLYSGWYEVRVRTLATTMSKTVKRRWFDVTSKTWSFPVIVGETPDYEVPMAQVKPAILGAKNPNYFLYRGLKFNSRAGMSRS